MAVTKRKNARTSRRAPTPSKKGATRSKKAVARKTKKPAVRTARSARSATAAAPLLTTSPKKIGQLAKNRTNAVNPPALFPFTPQEKKPATIPNFDPLAFARPWMRLCVQMAVDNFALQARMVRAATFMPQAAAAGRQPRELP
jgi:hypothetical protein